jgi:UDP-N-acetyl-D-glucosamine dehydrogenase
MMNYSACVIGLGYVGLPLLHELGKADLNVIGFDVDRLHVENLKQGLVRIEDLDVKEFNKLVQNGRIQITSELESELTSDSYIICVPTPLDEKKIPDLTYVISAANYISKFLKNRCLVVLESTTYPGTTEILLKNIFDNHNKILGIDYLLGYSPERIDPGQKEFSFKDIPKVIAGYDEDSLAAVKELYSKICSQVVIAKSLKVAEMSKLLENTFRHINIALVNELKQVCDLLEINVWEVIKCAETKPYGFMSFKPGIGVGGHCIPIDPNYLAFEIKNKFGKSFRFIDLANKINEEMPRYTVDLIKNKLKSLEITLNQARILLLGMAYKKNISDTRESPSLKVAEILKSLGCEINYVDPFVPSVDIMGEIIQSLQINDINRNWDLVVQLQAHDNFLENIKSRKTNFLDLTGSYE